MRIGAMIELNRPIEDIGRQLETFAGHGLRSAWASQIFGYDTLTLFAALADRMPDIDLGTGVVPVYGRHPQVLAQQALTVQAATGGRLHLGVGLSHQMVVESLWGLSYERPARYLREYLEALLPMLAGQTVTAHGEVVTANTYAPLEIPRAGPPSVLVAALGPVMLRLAGRMAAGTVTWMTGTETIRSHVAPTITAAAAEAGRPAPVVGVALPVVVTRDVERARQRVDEVFGFYPSLPSYRAMLDREGVDRPSEIALIGSEDDVGAALGRLEQAGATEFVAAVVGDAEERQRTLALLGARSSA